jgi:predicted porin
MKKSLIALAIAGVVAAPAFAATSNVDIYGQFRVSVDHLSGLSSTSPSGWGMNDETSRIGLKGSEDLGGGLKAIYQWETGFDPGTNGSLSTGTVATTAAGGLGTQRNTFVGLSGGFGTVLAGRHDTPYKLGGSADLFADTLADAQNTGARCIICEDLRVSNAIAYVSPEVSGFHGAIAIIPGNFQQSTATTKSLNSLSDAYSMVGVYANGPLKATAAYENLGHVAGNGVLATNSGSQSAWKLNGSYAIGDVTLGATYESIDKIGGDTTGANGTKMKDYLLSAAYGMGPITLAAQYGVRNPNGDSNSLKDTTLGVVYAMSKRTNTYVGYAHYKADANTSATGLGADNGKTLNALTMGMNHSF